MSITTMTSREFNQDTSGAKRAALSGPVFITDLLAMPDADDIDFDIPRLPDDFLTPAEL